MFHPLPHHKHSPQFNLFLLISYCWFFFQIIRNFHGLNPMANPRALGTSSLSWFWFIHFPHHPGYQTDSFYLFFYSPCSLSLETCFFLSFIQESSSGAQDFLQLHSFLRWTWLLNYITILLALLNMYLKRSNYQTDLLILVHSNISLPIFPNSEHTIPVYSDVQDRILQGTLNFFISLPTIYNL